MSNLTKSYIDKLAHTAATSPKNVLQEPTEAQKEAGNYKKGHLSLYGLEIAIENPVGSIRSGRDRTGKSWSIKMKYHYGYIKGYVGKDKDKIDCFIGNNIKSNFVYVVNQSTEDEKFDEHKILLAFDTFQDALTGYLDNYEKGWNQIKSMSRLTVAGFKLWLQHGNKTQPCIV